MHTFDEELRDWLQLDDIGGKVPNGSLKLSLPIESDISVMTIYRNAGTKDNRRGDLPIAPGWPRRWRMLKGGLTWQNQVLEARVEHAQVRRYNRFTRRADHAK